MAVEAALVYASPGGPVTLEVLMNGEKWTYNILSVKPQLLDRGMVYFPGAGTVKLAPGSLGDGDPPAELTLEDMSMDPELVGTVRAFLRDYREGNGYVRPGPYPITKPGG